MKKLPTKWHVNILAEENSPLLSEFKKWFENGCNFSLDWDYDSYGLCNGHYYAHDEGELITLPEWYSNFGTKVKFEQGELVDAKDTGRDNLCSGKFVCKYEGQFLVQTPTGFYLYDECKKKTSELDIKIEELYKLAEEKGVKLTIIAE